MSSSLVSGPALSLSFAHIRQGAEDALKCIPVAVLPWLGVGLDVVIFPDSEDAWTTAPRAKIYKCIQTIGILLTFLSLDVGCVASDE